MEYIVIILLICAIAVYSIYSPKIDIVLSGNKSIVLLWYYKYEGGTKSRTYKKLCELW